MLRDQAWAIRLVQGDKSRIEVSRQDLARACRQAISRAAKGFASSPSCLVRLYFGEKSGSSKYKVSTCSVLSRNGYYGKFTDLFFAVSIVVVFLLTQNVQHFNFTV